ncbi:hypothetical protein SODG_005347 [Sodalis praecaptivus]
MKTRLILDSALGQARSHVLRTVLADAAGKSGLKLVKDDPDAELWVLVGAGAGDATLSGKMAFQGTVVDAASDPDAFCSAPARRPRRIGPRPQHLPPPSRRRRPVLSGSWR